MLPRGWGVQIHASQLTAAPLSVFICTCTLSGLVLQVFGTPCCQNSFVILPRCFKSVEHAWRHSHVLDLFASSSSLGFCLIRLQHHTDIFRVHRHRDKPEREAEMSVPPQRSGGTDITLQHPRCVSTHAFLKGSGPPRYASTGRVINPYFSMLPGSLSGLSFKLFNRNFTNTMSLLRCN